MARCVETFYEVVASVMIVALLTHPIMLLLIQTTSSSSALISSTENVHVRHVDTFILLRISLNQGTLELEQ